MIHFMADYVYVCVLCVLGGMDMSVHDVRMTSKRALEQDLELCDACVKSHAWV